MTPGPPIQGSFKEDVDKGIGLDINMDSDMAVSIHLGAPFWQSL